jgi:hypothetical protein
LEGALAARGGVGGQAHRVEALRRVQVEDRARRLVIVPRARRPEAWVGQARGGGGVAPVSRGLGRDRKALEPPAGPQAPRAGAALRSTGVPTTRSAPWCREGSGVLVNPRPLQSSSVSDVVASPRKRPRWLTAMGLEPDEEISGVDGVGPTGVGGSGDGAAYRCSTWSSPWAAFNHSTSWPCCSGFKTCLSCKARCAAVPSAPHCASSVRQRPCRPLTCSCSCPTYCLCLSRACRADSAFRASLDRRDVSPGLPPS